MTRIPLVARDHVVGEEKLAYDAFMPYKVNTYDLEAPAHPTERALP